MIFFSSVPRTETSFPITSLMRTMSLFFILKKAMMSSIEARAAGISSTESRSNARISMHPDISHISRAPTTDEPLISGYTQLSP